MADEKKDRLREAMKDMLSHERLACPTLTWRSWAEMATNALWAAVFIIMAEEEEAKKSHEAKPLILTKEHALQTATAHSSLTESQKRLGLRDTRHVGGPEWNSDVD